MNEQQEGCITHKLMTDRGFSLYVSDGKDEYTIWTKGITETGEIASTPKDWFLSYSVKINTQANTFCFSYVTERMMYHFTTREMSPVARADFGRIEKFFVFYAMNLQRFDPFQDPSISVPKRVERFRVVVAGSRTFADYELLTEKLDAILKDKFPNVTIVSGTAGGADRLGEKYASEKGLEVARYPADWDTHGKKAGYMRNELMADKADAVIVFWDGVSAGSKHMIDIAKRKGLPCRVVRFDEKVT